MTSLEYIRNKISKKIKTINEKRNFMTNCKQMGIPFNSELTYEDEKELEYLRQVECELEAWEEIAPDLKEGKRIDISYLLRNNVDKFLKIKKALEVKE